MRPLAVLSLLAALLTILSSAAGLLIGGFYEPVKETTLLLVGSYAQDAVAIVVALLLLGAVRHAWRGSVRAVLLWAGCLGYFIYGYLLYTFDAAYTPLFPAYVAILGLSIFSLAGLLGGLDSQAIARRVSGGVPARALALVLAVPAAMVPPWIAFLIQGTMAGEPAGINSVLVIDLSFVIPASLLSAYLLWRRRAWGFVFAGPMLVKMTTMGGALTLSALWAATRDVPLDPVLPVYAFMAVVGGAALVTYLRHVGVAAPTSFEQPALSS
jgi:hypothetical protein